MPTPSDLRHQISDIRKALSDIRLLNSALRKGFTLIEIVLTLFLVLAILTILFATSGTFRHSREANLQGVATKIGSREIENLRNTDFSSLPGSGSISDPDLQKLPSGSATRTIIDYQANSKIKQVTINVSWIEAGIAKKITLQTLIAENGL